MGEASDSAIGARKVGTETADIDVTELLLRCQVSTGDMLQVYLLLGLLVDVIPIYKFFPLTRVNVIITEIRFLLFLNLVLPDLHAVPLHLAVHLLVVADLLLYVVDNLLDLLLLVGHLLRVLNKDCGVALGRGHGVLLLGMDGILFLAAPAVGFH